MKTASLFSLFAAFSLSLTSLAGCAADTSDDSDEVADESEDALTNGASNFGYWIVTKRDARKCASPWCGGFYVKRVNQTKTTCANGNLDNDCYVSAIQLDGAGLSDAEEADLRTAVESGHALIKARAYKSKKGGTWIGTLKANEGWIGATGSASDGTFMRVADNGIRCIKAPCPSTTAYNLNSNDSHNVVEVKLDSTAIPAEQEALDRASAAMGTKDGVMIAGGVALPKCVAGSVCGPFVTTSEFYLRAVHTEGKACGGRLAAGAACGAGQFCKWTTANMCGAFDASGKCAPKPQFCPKIYMPVCGCDGQTYGNECEANGAGTSVSAVGACPP